MKKLKKIMFSILAVCLLLPFINVESVKAYSLSKSDFKPQSNAEKLVGHTKIGSWNDGSFFETVTWDYVGYDSAKNVGKYRFRYYITHKGNSGSYIYQKVPVQISLDGKKIAEFKSYVNKHISNKTQKCGEITVSVKPGIHKIEFGDAKDGAITVVNVWKNIDFTPPSYKVTFVDYNGTILKTQTVPKNSNATPPSNPTLTGHTFKKWNGDYTNITSSRTITAQYDLNYYTVNFTDWNGKVLKSQSVGYGGNASPPSNPSRTGYTFSGWNGDYTNVTSNRTITAGYRINTYTVSFNSNGGSVVPSRVVTYGDVVGRPSDPTKANHKFMGWYTSLSFNAAYNFNAAVTSSFTLYARWDERPTIKAEDIVIFEKAYTPEKWKQVRMEDVTASDKEDGNITGKITVPYDNVDLNNQGEYKVRYEVTDSAGNKVTKEVKVTVISSKPPEENTYKRIRSISKEYINTLNVKSLWRVNADMSSLLTTTLNRADTNTRSVWKLSAEDIERIKEFNRTHDYSSESNALFLAQFGDLKH
ncbi:InlB B-repeat-containing protein [[Clostridium] innocuum]|nr:InlB B-repeat-containing protein [[Clostridium] innocuum]